MQLRRKAVVEIHRQAICLAERGRFEGEVYNSASDPTEIMTMAQLHDFEWDQESGRVIAQWATEVMRADAHFTSRTNIEKHLYEIATAANRMRQLKDATLPTNIVHRVLNDLVASSGQNKAVLPTESFQLLDFKLLDDILKPLQFEYTGCRHHEDFLDSDSPFAALVTLEFGPRTVVSNIKKD